MSLLQVIQKTSASPLSEQVTEPFIVQGHWVQITDGILKGSIWISGDRSKPIEYFQSEAHIKLLWLAQSGDLKFTVPSFGKYL